MAAPNNKQSYFNDPPKRIKTSLTSEELKTGSNYISNKEIYAQNKQKQNLQNAVFAIITGFLLFSIFLIYKFRNTLKKVPLLFLKIMLMFFLFYAGLIGLGKSIGMYDLLRLATCIGIGVFSLSWLRLNKNIAYAHWAICVLFNPIFKIRFTKRTWQKIDLVTGAFIFILIIYEAYRLNKHKT